MIEEMISGSVPACERPGFQKLLERMKSSDVLIETKLDRLGRNAMDVRQTVEHLAATDIRVHCLALGGVDLTSAEGKMTMQVLGAVAEFERDLLIERTQSGLKRSKAEGKKPGRPKAVDPALWSAPYIRKRKMEKDSAMAGAVLASGYSYWEGSQHDSISPSLDRGLAMDDEGDFKKARGFLFTYSCLVVGLWYFKAELTQFNLMGITLAFAHRKESVWLVVALINAYFWFRFYQRLPRNALYFDEPMHDIYDNSLVWLSIKWKRRDLKNLAAEKLADLTPTPDYKVIGWYSAEAMGRQSLAEDQQRNGDHAPELHQISREYRTKVHLSVGYRYTENGKWIQFPIFAYDNYQPGRTLTWTAKTYALLKGAFVTPWFTDYVAPLVLGGISTTIALWRWWEVNFFVA